MQESKARLSHICLGDKLFFQAGSNIEKYLLDGWSGQEQYHRWTEGGRARLQIHISELGTQDIILRMGCSGYFAAVERDHQPVEVLVNDNKVATWSVKGIDWHEAVVPNAMIKNGDMTVSFLIGHPSAPFDSNVSEDKRKLGLCALILEVTDSNDINQLDKKTNIQAKPKDFVKDMLSQAIKLSNRVLTLFKRK